MSKATAALLIKGGVSNIYAYKLSKHAISLLEQYNIEYSYGGLLDFISNGDKSSICPYEKMSLDINNVDKIVEILENSFSN